MSNGLRISDLPYHDLETKAGERIWAEGPNEHGHILLARTRCGTHRVKSITLSPESLDKIMELHTASKAARLEAEDSSLEQATNIGGYR